MRMQTCTGWVPTFVTGKKTEPCSYTVKTQNGNVYRRNRIHLRIYCLLAPPGSAVVFDSISKQISADILQPSGEEVHSTPSMLPTFHDSTPPPN